jgi:hypothetical protein
MCSCRTYVPMVACLTISTFSLRAALRETPELRDLPVALAPAAGGRPLVGPCTRAAEQAGVRPGMRLSEALATCPDLHLVEQDPATVEAEWELILRRLEEAGLAVEPAEPGCAYFETRGIERLAGGVRAAVQRALDAVGSVWEPRVGVAARRFAALAAASVAPAGRALLVDDAETELCPFTSFRSVPSAVRSCPNWESRGSASWQVFRERPLPIGSVSRAQRLGVSREARTTPPWCLAARPPSSPRHSSFPSRWRTSSRLPVRWVSSSNGCWPVKSGEDECRVAWRSRPG